MSMISPTPVIITLPLLSSAQSDELSFLTINNPSHETSDYFVFCDTTNSHIDYWNVIQ